MIKEFVPILTQISCGFSVIMLPTCCCNSVCYFLNQCLPLKKIICNPAKITFSLLFFSQK